MAGSRGRALAGSRDRVPCEVKGEEPLSLPAGSEIPSEAKRRTGSKNSPVDCFCVGRPSSGVSLWAHGVRPSLHKLAIQTSPRYIAAHRHPANSIRTQYKLNAQYQYASFPLSTSCSSSMFSSSLPVPSTTQSSGLSAMYTGMPVSSFISLSSPRSIAPPPASVIP